MRYRLEDQRSWLDEVNIIMIMIKYLHSLLFNFYQADVIFLLDTLNYFIVGTQKTLSVVSIKHSLSIEHCLSRITAQPETAMFIVWKILNLGI